MTIRRLTTALVVSALAGVGIVATATPSQANIGECGAGLPAVGTTPGVLTSREYVGTDVVGPVWYTTPTGGSFSVTLTVPAAATMDVAVGLTVVANNCSDQLCWGETYPSPTVSCSVTSPTPLSLLVYFSHATPLRAAVDYTLAVQSVPAIGGCNTVVGVTACASVTGTTTQGTYQVTTTATNVVARVDAYAFTLPGGGVVTLPCVVLVAGTTPVDPCLSAGGTYTSTLFSLARDASVPSVPAGTPFVGVNVCNANVVLTVNTVGVTSFPALTVC